MPKICQKSNITFLKVFYQILCLCLTDVNYWIINNCITMKIFFQTYKILKLFMGIYWNLFIVIWFFKNKRFKYGYHMLGFNFLGIVR